MIAGLVAGARFFGSLPGYLRRRVQPEEARQMVRGRLAGRGERLLDRLRRDIFNRPGSPYSQLMAYAGCEFGDLQAAVQADGVDAVLERLLRAGVYLTVDEFKGRAPVRRGASFRIDVRPEDLRSPRAAYHLRASTGGSRSAGTPVLIDLRFVRACAANCLVCLDAWGGREWIRADWETPGAGARFRLTKFGMFGDRPPQAWFTQIDPEDPLLPAIVKWNTRAMQWSSRLAGRPLPGPVACPLDNPEPVVRWMEGVLRSGATPLVFTFPGSAVRACATAAERGISLTGGRFLVAGEPITAARVNTLQRAGCQAIPRYGTIECGAIGYGCPHGEHSDDIHLHEHMFGLIQAGEHAPALGVVREALFLTGLDCHSPFLMLNVSMGDQAEMTRRRCGCPLEELGLRTHLHSVRSFEKLTAGGVTFHAGDVIPILESVLPGRFGGTATDYQLVEEETAAGDPVLTLRVNPAVGPTDGDEVKRVFLESLGSASVAAAAMARMWKDSGTLQVARESPVISAAGKILHLHVTRKR